MRLLPLLACFALAGCIGGYPAPRPAAAPVFDPIAFFTGRTEGRGSVRILFRARSALAVHGVGRVERDGSLVLDQRIARSGRAAERRQWRIRRTGPGRYAATLSSADGPVAVSVEGNLMRLDFRQKGVAIHQDVLLAPDGRSAANHMVMTKLGLRVAAIEEHISRLDSAGH
jgi:hypothetical protein